MKLLVKLYVQILADPAVFLIELLGRLYGLVRTYDLGRRAIYLLQLIVQLLQLLIIVRLHNVVMIVKLVKVERLLHHLGVLGQAGFFVLREPASIFSSGPMTG